MAKNYTNPWADAANQAVGAMYKYYMSQPNPADAQAAAIKNDYDLARTFGQELDNESNMMLLGRNIPHTGTAAIQNFGQHEYLNNRPQAQQIFDAYVNKPMQVDAGDKKFIVSGSTGLPLQSYGVGLAPERKFDLENNRFINAPPIPSADRPIPIQPDIQQGSITDVLMNAVAKQESNFDPNALSPKGAAGKFQIMPDTARQPGYGVLPLQNWDGIDPRTAPPEEQERFATDYMNAMIRERGGNVQEGLAAYNAGPGAVEAAGGIPNYPETQQYVENITNDINQTVDPNNVTVTTFDEPASEIQRKNARDLGRKRQADSLDNAYSSAIYLLNQGGSAGIWTPMKDIPIVGGQTQAGTLEKDIKRISAKEAIDEIARLKNDESKTGGFFGNLSDGEREAVADAMLGIQQNMKPEELAYRLMVAQDVKNDIIMGKLDPDGIAKYKDQLNVTDWRNRTNSMPTVNDIKNAQTVEELQEMWDVFGKHAVFEGRPPGFVRNEMIQKLNELR